MQISPRPLGQVLGDATNSLGRVWRPLVSTGLWVFIPVGALTLAVFHFTGATEFLDLVFNDPGYLQTLSRDVFYELARPLLVATGIALAIQALASVFVYLSSHKVVVSDLAGVAITGRGARAHALRRLPTAYLATLMALVVVGVIFGIGLAIWLIPVAVVGVPNATAVIIAIVLFAAFAGPGIWLMVSFSMLTPVLAVERHGPLLSLARSLRLVKGRWWPTLGFLLLVGLVGSVAIQLIQLVAIPLSVVGDLGMGISFASLLGIGAQGLIVAGIGAIHTVWYIDLRSRKESLLSEDLG